MVNKTGKRNRPARRRIVRVATAVAALVSLAVLGPSAGLSANASAQDEVQALREPTTLGSGTELGYENCYEHVGAFRVPIADIGVELPAGFQYQTFDPAGTIGQLVVVGLDCELDGTQVTDLYINANVVPPPGFSANLVRVRGYTSHPHAAARLAQWCFGDVVRLGDVAADVELSPNGREGRVFGTDGVGSIELLTSTPGIEVPVPAATIRHLTVKEGEVHGILEFTADAALRDRGTATLVLDGHDPIVGLLGQHVYPAPGQTFTFTYTGLNACPPGLDWID